MVSSNKAKLSTGVASMAVVFTLAQPAEAACTPSGSTVTCDSAGNTVADVNTAIAPASITPPNVSLILSAGSTVVGPGTITVDSLHNGAVSFTNSGLVGTALDNVNFQYVGDHDTPTSNFTGVNNAGAVIDGQYYVDGVGSANLNNAGQITGNVNVISDIFTSSTNDGVESYSYGGTATVTNSGVIGTVGSPSYLYVYGADSASVVNSGSTGFITVYGGSQPGSSTPAPIVTVDGLTTTSRQLYNYAPNAGSASLNITGTGSSAGLYVESYGTGGASVTVDGAVGTDLTPGGVEIYGSANDYEYDYVSATTTDGSNVSTTETENETNKDLNGLVKVAIGATGSVTGNLYADGGAGGTTAIIAGTVGTEGFNYGVTLYARSNDSVSTWKRTEQSTPTSAIRTYASDYTTTSSGGAATADIAATGYVYGDVEVYGGSSATLTNAGRIGGSVYVEADGGTTHDINDDVGPDSLTEVTAADGTITSVAVDTESHSIAPSASPASFTNAAGALVEGRTTVSGGTAGATLVNNGTLVQDVSLRSNVQSYANNSQTNSTQVLATVPTPSTTVNQSSTISSTSSDVGGAVSGTYAGTVGAFSTMSDPGFAADVEQRSDLSSVATISGTIVGNFSGSAYGGTSTGQSTQNLQYFSDAIGTDATITVTSKSNFINHATTSSATITGTIADLNDTGNGNVEISSVGGAATLAINGGTVQGNANLSAGGYDQFSDSGYTEQYVDSALISQQVNTVTSAKGVAADAVLTMNGGTVGRSVDVTATRDATVTIDAGSSIGGDLDIDVAGNEVHNNNNSNFVFSGGIGTNTNTGGYSGAPTSGNALANVAGKVGGEADVSASQGNATLNLTGQVAKGLNVQASGGTYAFTQTTTTAPSSTQTTANYSTVASGGTAKIDIQSTDALKAAQTPAVVQGFIYARGYAAASVTIGAGSRVFTDADLSSGSTIEVNSAFEDLTSSSAQDTSGTGTQHSAYNTVAKGGTAIFSNAGTVGFATESILSGYYDAPIDVDLNSATAVDFTNSGILYGDVYVKSLGGTYSETSDFTDNNTTPVETETRTWTKGGGTLAFTNSGLIGGDLDLTSETATVTNTGVIRGVAKLGSSQQNYTVEGPDSGTPTIVALGGPFTQTYTLNQKGFLAGASDTLFDNLNGPTAIAITGAIEDNSPSFAVDPSIAPASGPFISNNIVATVNLDAGSVTIGNIVAEHDADTGARYMKSALNLNGNGYLGLSGVDDFRLKETISTLAAFSAKDPLLTSANLGAAATAVGAFTLGSRVLGLDTVTKTGTGVFVINGATYIDAAPTPAWTMDVGTFAIKGGEAQLDVSPFTYDAVADEFTAAATPEFAIRGNVVNDASLVIGRRLPGDTANPLSSSVVDGIEVYIKGNLTQSATGTLVMGAATQTTGTGSVSSDSFVTSQALPVGTVTSQAVASAAFSTQALGQVLPVSYATTVFSSPSHITVDGDLNLAGKIDIATGPTAIYLDGTRTDLFDVSGAVNINVKTLTNGVDSPFLDFNYDTRSAGDGTTVVGVQVKRNSYTTQAADLNVVHMGTVLDGLLPRVVQQLTDGTFSSAQNRANVEDFATVLAMLDTQLDEGEIADAMQELTSGEFYGSLAATRTTDPFGDFTRNLPRNTGEKALNLWINPAGSFLRQGRYSVYGASGTRTNNYGGSIGFGGTSASGFSYGIGFGYGDIDQDARGTPEHANADTYMVGIFAQVPLSQINLGVQAVYGWSNWKTSRAMPTFGRTATAKFDSNEFRVIAEASHNFELGKVDIVPFLRGDLRHYSFDGFTEVGGGSIGLIVDKKSKTLFSPEVGAKIVGNYGSGNAKIHPEASVSYTLQGDVGGNRDVAFLIDPASKFRLQGTDPDAFWTFGAGLSAQIGSKSTAYLRGAFASGGDQHGASFSAGVKIGF